MAIKRVGGAPIDGARLEGARETGGPKTSASGFGQVHDARPAGVTAGTEADVALARAVDEVATRVRAGELAGDEQRVDAVVARMVELRLGEGVPADVVAARVDDVQSALSDHPVFERHVATLLDDALAASE